MSTSSSSECNCLYSHHDTSYNYVPSYNYNASYNYGAAQTPFYPIMGQPLVYYAQVSNGPERNRSRGANPNCFVKAYRWYTQERYSVGGGRQTVRVSNSTWMEPEAQNFQEHYSYAGGKETVQVSNSTYMEPEAKNFQERYSDAGGKQTVGVSNPTRMEPDIASFATWLDSKYEEFVRESRMNHNNRLNTTQTRIPEADDGTNNDLYCEPCAPRCVKKKYGRLRSQWKRRRSSVNKKDLGDGYETTNKSLEYIMEPKDLHRPASANYNTTSYCSGSHESKKISVKSQSITCIGPNTESHSLDEVTIQDGDNIRPPPTVIMPIKDAADEAKITKTKNKVPSKKSIHEVYCQCPVPSVVNRQNQYDSSNTSDNLNSACSNNQPKESPSPAPQTTVPRQRSETKPSAESTRTAPLVATEKANIPCCDCDKPVPKYRAQLCLSCQCPTYLEDDTVCCVNRIICSTREPSRQQDETMSRPILQEPSPSGLASEVKTENLRTMTCSVPRDSVEVVTVKRTSILKQSSHAISMSDTAQTSDHSINLGEGTHGYPLFMKIICADKLDEEVKKGNI